MPRSAHGPSLDTKSGVYWRHIRHHNRRDSPGLWSLPPQEGPLRFALQWVVTRYTSKYSFLTTGCPECQFIMAFPDLASCNYKLHDEISGLQREEQNRWAWTRKGHPGVLKDVGWIGEVGGPGWVGAMDNSTSKKPPWYRGYSQARTAIEGEEYTS